MTLHNRAWRGACKRQTQSTRAPSPCLQPATLTPSQAEGMACMRWQASASHAASQSMSANSQGRGAAPLRQLLRVKKAAERLARAEHARRRAARHGRRGAAPGAPAGCRQSAARPRRPPLPGWRTGARRRPPPLHLRTLRPGAPGRPSRRPRPPRCRRHRRRPAAAAGPQGPRAARGPQGAPLPRLAARPTAKLPAAASSPAHSRRHLNTCAVPSQAEQGGLTP